MTIATGDGWRLVRGDCLAGLRELADDSVDVVLTDPPYEAEAHTKGKRQGPASGSGRRERGKAYVRAVDAEFDFAPITEQQRADVSRHIGRVARSLALVFCQVEAAMLWRAELEAGGLVYRRTIPWVKPDAMPSLHGRWPGQSFEAMVLALRPRKTAPIGGKAIYYEATRERGDARAHPTAKPLALMLALVEHFSRPGDLVLDPFAGSGTTGVACRMLGRRFLGWELAACARCASGAEWDCSWLDAKQRPQRAYLCDAHRDEVSVRHGFRAHRDNYFEIACRRLNGERAKSVQNQPELF